MSHDWGKKKATPVPTPPASTGEGEDCSAYVEERFGRNLSVELADSAKLAIRRRIAGSLIEPSDELTTTVNSSSENVRSVKGFSEKDVYLYPTGMSSIFNAHQLLLAAFGEGKMVCFGYVLSFLAYLLWIGD